MSIRRTAAHFAAYLSLSRCLLAPTAIAAEPAPVAGIDQTAINPNVRPQDDFNAYANGSWIERTAIPDDRSSWGSFAILRRESEAHQNVILTELAQAAGAARPTDEQKAGLLFTSLMVEPAAKDAAITPIRAHLDRVDAIASRDDLVRTFAEFRKVGIDVPVVLYIAPDSHDASRYAVFMAQSGLGLPNRSYYLDQSPRLEEIRTAYTQYLDRLFTLAGRPDGAAAATRILALETKLATAHWKPEDNRDATKTDNRYAVSDLPQLTGEIPWAAFWSTAGFPDLQKCYVRQPGYVTALGDLLRDESMDDWKLYLHFHVLNHAAPWLSGEFFQARHELYGRQINGLQAPEPRWRRAVQEVNGAMGEAVGRAYVARHFPPEAKERMDRLVQHLLRAFEVSLQQLTWMSPETRARAEEKRARLGTKIGYPARWKDYAALEIRADDPVGNLERAARWEYERRRAQLPGPVDRDEWGMTPQTVNAYFSSRLNEIVFPAAILQPPFFHLSADEAVNYGAIGAVIGHEIGHAFDDQGRKTDAFGNLRDWWTEADARAFAARAEALVAQYNAYEALPDLRVNGRLTLGENIGDLSGLYIAYLAWQTSLGGREPPVIDGLTGKQRFFLGYAQIFRSKLRPEFARRLILTDPHSPAQFRINGVLRNFDPFYEAFAVREGDKMYLPPEQRVRIW